MFTKFEQALRCQHHDNRDAVDGFTEHLVGEAHESQQRLNVYRNNVYASLIDALGDIFPVTKQVVGEAFFHAMAAIFIRYSPPTSPILSAYGANLPTFLREFPPAQSVPFLPDLADFEFRRLQVTHLAEGSPMSVEAMQIALTNASSPDDICFRFCANVMPFRYDFAVSQIWDWHQSNVAEHSDQAGPAPLAMPIDMKQVQTEQGIFYKNGLYAAHLTLTADEFTMLNHLLAGDSLGSACQKLASMDEDTRNHMPDNNEALDLGHFIARLMQCQIIEAIGEITVPN